MISAREDIANATKESIEEWGFEVLIVYPSGESITVTANGRKTTTEVNADGMPVIGANPYISVPIADIATLPVKGCKVKAPADFFRPTVGDPVWYSVDRDPSKGDEDWFVKIYLTKTEQEEPA
jgi:hypothetical protein